jgi:hypothetical protein
MLGFARAVGIATLLVACGGSSRGDRLVHATVELGHADPATIRALLAQYAPFGYAILTTYEAMPTRYELVSGAVEVSTNDTFDGYLRDGALESLVTYTSTAVHEITHMYTSRMALQLQVERGLPYGDGAQAILVDDEPRLVPFTPTFPSIELDPTFPPDARTFRYGVYITPDSPSQGTQSQGIYGLLDELTASYQDARVSLAFWPWVRDHAPADARVIMNYAVLLDDLQRGHDEFTLFILHYLRHAREHRPDVYDAVIANADFRGAFLAVHDAYGALVAEVTALEPTVWAFARTRGVILERLDGQLAIDGNPQRSGEDAAIRAIRAHLASEPYRAELAALRDR